MAGSYHVLDDIALADAAFEAEGASPTELCDAAGRAVMEMMADPTTVGTSWSFRVERTAETLADLLFDWLNELVFLKDAHGVLFHHLQVAVGGQDGPEGWHLAATIAGAPVDPSTQELRADIKAVTKHLYDVTRDARGGWRARVVVDV